MLVMVRVWTYQHDWKSSLKRGSFKKKRTTAQLSASKSSQTVELATKVCISQQPSYIDRVPYFH